MRIYFMFGLQSNTLLSQEIARYYKETLGWHEFAGIMAVKEGPHHNFILNQQEINYEYVDVIDKIEKEALDYECDQERLAEWEQRLDIPLWHLVIADRNIGHMFVTGGLIPPTSVMEISSHENIARFLCSYLDFYEKRLEKYQPDAVVYLDMPAAMPSLALAKVCQWMNVPFFVLHSARILDRFVISYNDTASRFFAIEKRFVELLNGQTEIPTPPEQAIKYLDSFQSGEIERPNADAILFAEQKMARQENIFLFWGRLFRWFLGATYRWIRTNFKHQKHLRTKRPFAVFWLKARRQLSMRYRSAKMFESPRIGEEKFVLFPLHLDPEASTMVWAPNFVNQLTVIDALAKNIPLTHKLYVKEHHTMIGLRPSSFYKEVKRYPNVRLIAANADNHQLIRHADLVAVITGTSGWEAIMMGRPVITLGECFYADLGFSERCSDFNRISKQIRRLIFNRDDFDMEKHKERLLLFLTALYEGSFPLSAEMVLPEKPFSPGQLDDSVVSGAHTIADQILKAIDTYKADQSD